MQIKFMLTQPRPITSMGSSFTMRGSVVGGVSIVSPLGDAAGTAVMRDGLLHISIVSPASDFGMNLDDYPFLTLTMSVPNDLAPGSAFPLSLDESTVLGPDGALDFSDSKPGTLTIGGSVSISGVFPGGGTQPAGAVIRVLGSGFNPGSKLSSKMKISNPVYISSNEMRFTLRDATRLDSQSVTVVNSDGSQATFYSYLRGNPVRTPSRALLLATDPIFASGTHGLARFGPLPSSDDGSFTAVAVQNPGPGPVSVTFQLARTGAQSTVVLQAGDRVMDEISALLGGAVVLANDVVEVTSTSGVQILGLSANEVSGTVAPFLPEF